ncbi:Serine/threonine-protein kinase C [Variovorax sp. SRS16]|uniref:serine/threonine-protein kinase n=1 Tax=Variovorax sp. SRS16 TaxID=282217 RepID=UPI0013179FA5|nr:serine/threonine-protein kinase [Variovorax sp. SRS16]VTU32053.1 Serine/threonine-protein kinase C [Variovorax sp. SRS16]
MNNEPPASTAPPGDDFDPTQVITGRPAPAPAADDGATIITAGSGSPAAARDIPTVAAASRNETPSHAEAGLLPVGSRLAEFEVTRIVGQGGFGVVYEAWDPTLERVVAIKEYLPTSLSTRQLDGTVMPLSERHRETFELGMRSFINEARLLAQFDHPSLLKVYRFWQERGTTYMVMPFYRGDTLRQALAGMPGGVDEGWLLRIMDGVTQALSVMHAAHCYHRDIAPDNIILLEGSGRPVVLDFGAARRVITDKTQAITVILKPGYAPIEQYAEMPDMSQGAWTDVYALAAVMHVAVCGRAPPPSVARLLSDSYVPLAGNELLRQRYGAGLLAAIDAGLGVRPESRPQSMAELREALGLDGGATVIRPPAVPAAYRVPPPAPAAPVASGAGAASPPAAAPSRKGAVVAAAGLVAVLAAAGGWWFLQGRSADTQPAVAAAPPAPVEVAQAPAPAPVPPPPPAPPPTPRTPAESLQSLAEGAAPGFVVSASTRKPEVLVGKDKLSFEVRSQREGFVYVFLLSSANEMFLLFPNLLDKYNKIGAGATLSLPRASWPMDAGGPKGIDRFAVLVSEHERDFSAAGVQNDGVFPQFPLPVLAALEASRGSGPPPLLGKPVCAPGAPCNDVYGVGTFQITEK